MYLTSNPLNISRRYMKIFPNILIVDDLKENLLYLEVLLSSMDINIISALSGPEALRKVDGVDLALAIIDVRMPLMNGYELAVKLNENRKENQVPLIFLTANYISEIDVSKGYNSGAVDYIIKPVDNLILLSKIRVFIELFYNKQIIIDSTRKLKSASEKLVKANEALRASEEKYRSYIRNAPDGVFVVNDEWTFTVVNDAFSKFMGLPKEEIAGQPFSNFFQPPLRDDLLEFFSEDKQEETFRIDYKHSGDHEDVKWLSIEVVKLPEGSFLGFSKNITLRVKAEYKLKDSLAQLHSLTQYIEKVREEERVSISRELHDDIGQALTAIKIDLSSVRQKINDQEINQKLKDVMLHISETIKTVQQITSQLRPQIIDDLGIDAAIEWYARDFARRYNTELELDIEPGIPLLPDTSKILYRIMQESLTNIARHASANRVVIKLFTSGDTVNLQISDNGSGISVEQINSKRSFGIISMSERAASIGGKFDIQPDIPSGTVIKITIPINPTLENENSDL